MVYFPVKYLIKQFYSEQVGTASFRAGGVKDGFLPLKRTSSRDIKTM
jgi:hypothetical protein